MYLSDEQKEKLANLILTSEYGENFFYDVIEIILSSNFEARENISEINLTHLFLESSKLAKYNILDKSLNFSIPAIMEDAIHQFKKFEITESKSIFIKLYSVIIMLHEIYHPEQISHIEYGDELSDIIQYSIAAKGMFPEDFAKELYSDGLYEKYLAGCKAINSSAHLINPVEGSAELQAYDNSLEITEIIEDSEIEIPSIKGYIKLVINYLESKRYNGQTRLEFFYSLTSFLKEKWEEYFGYSLPNTIYSEQYARLYGSK